MSLADVEINDSLLVDADEIRWTPFTAAADWFDVDADADAAVLLVRSLRLIVATREILGLTLADLHAQHREIVRQKARIGALLNERRAA